ncbi:helix-turn-helix domain-containing protein [Erythrobacter sp. R86502]|uniref:helix-turn-helix domain-containing protein n=1 Tax=Erythrobacter sp. R86502 TaxID=3093846 RepID=UPI0036D40001
MKCARVSLELTQAQLAARLGIARQTLTGYEQGHTDPPASLLAQLCDDYAIDRVWLLLGHQPPLMVDPTGGAYPDFQGTGEEGRWVSITLKPWLKNGLMVATRAQICGAFDQNRAGDQRYEVTLRTLTRIFRLDVGRLPHPLPRGNQTASRA